MSFCEEELKKGLNKDKSANFTKICFAFYINGQLRTELTFMNNLSLNNMN